jgi:type II secretory pathway component PulF
VSLKKGKTLHEAFVELPFKIHPFMMVYLFAFEHYGNLQQGFSDLSCYFFEKDQQKKNAQKSYRYPFFLFFIFVNLIFLFHYQIIPVFEDILLSVSARQNSHSFERFKQLTYYFLIFFGGTSILVVVLFCLRFFSSHFREKMDSFLFKAEHRINIQSIKNFLFIFNQKEILNILIPLAHLLKQQVHLTKSLSLLTECTSNLYLKSVIFNILKDVKQGQSFFQSLERTKHFPNFLLSAVLIGENSDDFPELFYKATLFFKDDLDIRTRRFFEFLGPFLIFIAGMFIVLIIMSTILPFYEHMVQIAVSS